MAAAEISIDKDWARYKLSAFYASGDGRPRDSRATGFDAIVDDTSFAGGIFSFWNREGLRLTGTGIALTSPDSLLPSLRTDKTEGQANFVNPGIFVLNAGATFDLTPKLKVLANINYLRFESTAPIELLLLKLRFTIRSVWITALVSSIAPRCLKIFPLREVRRRYRRARDFAIFIQARRSSLCLEM